MNEPDYIRFIADHGIKTEEDAANYIKNKTLARFAAHGVGLWILDLKPSLTPVGVCGLVVRPKCTVSDARTVYCPRNAARVRPLWAVCAWVQAFSDESKCK